jgi:hypothetical protein
VLVTGDRAKVRLVSGAASHGPGVVPVGSYELRVSFDGGAPVAAGRVEVPGAWLAHALLLAAQESTGAFAELLHELSTGRKPAEDDTRGPRAHGSRS